MKLGPRQKQWVKDLRAGYPKAECTLARVDPKNHKFFVGFCCLGVYAHTQVKAEWIISDSGFASFGKGKRRETDLGLHHTYRLGLRDLSGSLSEHVQIDGVDYVSLMEVNDDAGKDHAWMADFIEEHADKIFTRSA